MEKKIEKAVQKYGLSPAEARELKVALRRHFDKPLSPLIMAPVGAWERCEGVAACEAALEAFSPDEGEPLASWIRAGALLRLPEAVPTAPGVGSPIDWAARQNGDVLNAVASMAHAMAIELEDDLADAMAVEHVGEVEFEALCRQRERLENLRVMLPRLGPERELVESEMGSVDGLGGAFVVGREPPKFWNRAAWRQSARADWDVWWNGAFLVEPL